MKKLVAGILFLIITLSCVACGNETNDSDTSKTVSQSQSIDSSTPENTNENDVGTVTMDDLLNAPTSSEDDFSFNDNSDNGLSVVRYKGAGGIVVIPEKAEGKDITKCVKYLFANDCDVSAIKFPDSMIEIVESNCGLNANIQIVYIGDKVKTIGMGAFQGCSGLREIRLNNGLESIGEFAFAQCSALKSIYIPDSVISIDSTAFYGLSDEFKIYGDAGSYAEEFANEQGIAFLVQ